MVVDAEFATLAARHVAVEAAARSSQSQSAAAAQKVDKPSGADVAKVGIRNSGRLLTSLCFFIPWFGRPSGWLRER